MKRIVTAIAAGVLLAGCSTASTDSPTTPKQTPVQGREVLRQALFLSMLRKDEPAMASVSDSQLLDVAHTICSGFDSGLSGTQVVNVALGTGMTTSQVGHVVGYSIAAFCPEYTSELGSQP